jgi:hypothetical protein
MQFEEPGIAVLTKREPLKIQQPSIHIYIYIYIFIYLFQKTESLLKDANIILICWVRMAIGFVL